VKNCICYFADFRCTAESTQVEKFLEQGKKLLAAGQLSDALAQYHAAVGMYEYCKIRT
jgi:hypothetical protein